MKMNFKVLKFGQIYEKELEIRKTAMDIRLFRLFKKKCGHAELVTGDPETSSG